MPAFDALMDDNMVSLFDNHFNRFHHAAARCRAVTWVDINMPAPETFWAMIGVAVACGWVFTMFAGEIFFGFFEFFCLKSHYVKQLETFFFEVSKQFLGFV